MSHLAAERNRPDREAAKRVAPVWAVLAVVCGGQFLVVLDVSVVNVALPSIRADLGLGETGLQWVVSAYVLTYACLLLLGGRIADLFGRERTFLVGLGLFTVASLVGGLAQGPWMLVAARTLQGIGGAALAPTTLSILTTSFPEGAQRARAIGTWTAVGAGGGTAGGLIGGLLTDYLSWRWVLLVNVPIGALLLVGAALCLPVRRGGLARRLDMSGTVLVTAGVAALAYGITTSEPHGWTSGQALLPVALGLIALVLFIRVESRTAEPLVPLGLFRLRSVSVANTVLFAVGAATFAIWYFLSLYMQNVLHYSPVRTGLCFLPHTVSVIVGSKLAPRLMNHVDGRLIGATGGLLAVGGMLWQSTLSAHGTFAGSILGPGVLTLTGVGLLMTPVTTAATAGVPMSEQGVVSGLLNTASQLSGALGLTILATAAANRISAFHGGVGDAGEALVSGYAVAFRIGAVFLLVGTALIALLPKWAPRQP
ncbi:MFS transporter [Streptomyces sp. NPDC023723]|uniref:MFS transporter n=1 Tax=Streptomyces sp. NPDC023723 TaxID=3154323 RepID=UPI0033C07C9C